MPEGKGIPEQTPDGETAHETNLLQSFVPQLATQPADIEVGYPPDLQGFCGEHQRTPTRKNQYKRIPGDLSRQITATTGLVDIV